MMVKEYPFVDPRGPVRRGRLRGPRHPDDAKLDIQITGDDLFTTDPVRVQKGIEVGAANTVLLKVNQIGTISEALDMIQLAYRNGYGVMPCSSRGEGEDIADYCVGINAGYGTRKRHRPHRQPLPADRGGAGQAGQVPRPKGFKGRRFQK